MNILILVHMREFWANVNFLVIDKIKKINCMIYIFVNKNKMWKC